MPETGAGSDFFATDPLHERHRLLAFLLPMLQAKGFQITPDRQIRLQRLLYLLPPDVPGRDLADSLCPIFATDSREQNLFHEEFLKLDFLFVSTEEMPAEPSQTPNEKPKDQTKPTPENQEKKSPAPEKPAEPSKPKTPEPSKPQADKPKNPLIPDIEKCTDPPYLWKIAPDENIPLETSGSFGRTLTRLRSRELSEARQIDWPKTLRDTARQPGTLQLRHRRRSRPVEYLMLVERFSADDHRALLFDRLWRMLRDQEVLVERFFHDGDLRNCHNEQFPTGIPLRDLSHRFAHSRLLVLGTGHRMLNPVTGQPADWTKTLPDWRLRALLTPISRREWGLPEKNISGVFPLLPAAWESVEYFSELTGSEEKTRFAELPAYVRDAADWQPLVLEKPLMRSLRQHFDENMCAWIAACALWPSLHFDLTLRLGRLFSTPENDLLTLEKFTRLCRLDWFANGYIPRPERHELLEYLEARFPEKLRTATDVLLNLLEQNLTEIPKNSRARAEHQINLAILRLMNTENPDPETVQQLRTVIKRLDWAAEITDFVLPASVEVMVEKFGLEEKQPAAPPVEESPNRQAIEEGDVIGGRYKIRMPIRKGYVAMVWLATDLSTETSVAIKVFPKNDLFSEKIAQHENEMHLLLDHPNIAKSLGFGIEDGFPYLVLEYFKGGTVTKHKGKLSENELWKIIHDIGSALENMHGLRPPVLHGDISPERFYKNENGNYVLSGLGFAEELMPFIDFKNKNWAVIPGYEPKNLQKDPDLLKWRNREYSSQDLAPEQMEGTRFYEERSAVWTDIWHFGAALYQLATAERYYAEQGGIAQTVKEYSEKGSTWYVPEKLPNQFSPELSALIQKCLEITSTVRPTVGDMVAAAKRHFGIEMIPIKGGTFKMDEDYIVTLSDYEIGKYPVTQKLWRDIMGDNPSHFKGDDLPVERVSWDDCQRFLEKLNQKFPGKNYRLPTEAEWEFAARGGTLSKGYEYAGSNDLNEVGWFSGNSGSQTHPVGQKKTNELGIHDMSGNVWEWCQDWYDDYPSEAQTNPTGPVPGSDRVLRGGSWSSFPQDCRVAYRNDYAPGNRGHDIGFRLARTN